jgi:glutamyl-tRNA(Gln) amidotransferase subunit E
MNYEEIGFRAGLEIHQQLDTHKLFCRCQSVISEKEDYSFERYLRPTQSEMGDVDRAALEEARRKRRFLYSASVKSTCLVEADEEPPHSANEEAVDICLMVALLLGAKPVDEVQFMRKIVIDGSNTTGFQRTALIAMNGKVDDVGVDLIALEEDAARKLSEEGRLVNYGLDRLGIPLIEIATAADIKNPRHAREVAEEIGLLLQATKKVKKGLGTIRQDLNISISEGSRVEIKGIQSLGAVSKAAENEVLRQLETLRIKDTLNKRGKKEYLNNNIVDLTGVFKNTGSTIIKQVLNKKGCVKGVRLHGFHGLLSGKHARIGRELTVYARVSSGINIVFHSDELPAYGVTQEEAGVVMEHLKVKDNDAFVIASGGERVVDHALSLVVERAKMFFDGVPEEVRRCLPDSTTEYMRPLPGAARMYPETDVPPVRITMERIKKIKLPERPREKHRRFLSRYDLNEEQVRQLLSSGYEDDFERLVRYFPSLKNVIVRTFLNTFAEMENEGIPVEGIDDDMLIEVFEGLSNGRYAKEAIPILLKHLVQHPGASLEEAVETCGLTSTSEEDVVKIIRKITMERKQFIEERGRDALGPLMGIVMKQLRGKADGKVVSKILKEEIEKMIISS